MNPNFTSFKVRVVEQIKVTTKRQREKILQKVDYNLFSIRAEDVMLDFLTDSGTGALSHKQVAAMLLGDESYACSKSWYRFENAVSNLFGFKHIIPTHQGRAAERILFSSICETGMIVPNNGHFDTTRANIEKCGSTAIDIPIKESRDANCLHPFKGNVTFSKLQ